MSVRVRDLKLRRRRREREREFLARRRLRSTVPAGQPARHRRGFLQFFTLPPPPLPGTPATSKWKETSLAWQRTELVVALTIYSLTHPVCRNVLLHVLLVVPPASVLKLQLPYCPGKRSLVMRTSKKKCNKTLRLR